MSGRFKRHLSKAGSSSADAGGSGTPSAMLGRKKRKVEVNSSEDEERSFWTPKHLGDLKAYNRSATEAPAELFRKDLISAMKLADNEPLTDDDFWGISDQWKQEWERGVQVPVNPDSLPEPSVNQHQDYIKPPGDFRLPTKKYIRVTHSDFFNNEKHILSNVPTKAEKMCRYDMDNLDDAWLQAYNGERARMGAEPVPLAIFELIVEHFEETCWENIHKLLKTEESLSMEFDEDVICDVCRSPDSEDGNEMVFCDTCNICVHQACYGITAIPSGSWLCRTCSLGIKPNCVLCPNKGGSMKSTKSGHKWAHVACALWIPEVSIGSVERMEPITKISTIPHSRWALVCVLCRERLGACIQCSVKSCKTAYHVTCAFKHGLEMKAIFEDEDTDGVKLRSYCEKHSRNNKKDNSDADSDGGGTNSHKKKKDWTSEQKNQARAAQLRKIEAEFHKHVDVLQTSTVLDIDYETTETIFYYWKLKRKSVFNKPLLTPRCQELDLLAQQQEQDIERMKMFVQLRQYLERVRNLCYMVVRREKQSKHFVKTREQTFLKQSLLLSNPNICLSSQERDAVLEANHSPSIYDQMFSHPSAPVHTPKQYDKIVRLIAGTYKGKAKSLETEQQQPEVTVKPKKFEKDVNGLIRKQHSHPLDFMKDNPYRKTYVNGAEQRRSRSKSISHGSTDSSSAEDSDSSLASTKWKPPEPGSRLSVYTSSDDDRIPHTKPDVPKGAFSSFDYRAITKREAFDTTDEEEMRIKMDETRLTSARDKSTKRGRGRPPQIKSSEKNSDIYRKDKCLFSSEDDKPMRLHSPIKDSKAFDDLMRGISRSTLHSESSFIVKIENDKKITFDSSEDEVRTFSQGKSSKSKSRRKILIKKEVIATSSEEDVPIIKSLLSKRGKKRGRGKIKNKDGSLQLTSLPPMASPLSNKLSEDDLGPATYKLTSEDDDVKSDRSNRNESSYNRRHLSDRTDNSLSDPDTSCRRETRKTSRRGELSNSEAANSDTELKDNQNEAFNHSHMKTKAAMKEFTPKLEAKMEKIKKGDKTLIKPKKSASSEKVQGDSKNSRSSNDGTDLSLPKESMKGVDIEACHDLTLFVPQRAAAKKASELITSQNTGALVSQIIPPSAQETPEIKKPTSKPKEVVSEAESICSSTDEHKKSSQKTRKIRSSKDKQDDAKTETLEPPKKNIFEPPQILPYVPIREAARKAAENFKGGGNKSAVPSVPEEADIITPPKVKKTMKPEVKSVSLRSTRTKSPHNISKSTIVTDSENEREPIGSSYSPSNRKSHKEPDTKSEKSKSIFSESEDEGLLSPKREKLIEKPPEPNKELPHKQQLFRGDIFIFNHQSSSENEDEKNQGRSREEKQICKTRKNRRSGDGHKHKLRVAEEKKSHSFRSPRITTKAFGSEQGEEEHENENEEPPAETRRKAPDKKLKTSDGRPEHGFQPPVTKRNESRVASDKSSDEISSSLPSPKKTSSLLRESGSQRRSRAASGDLSKKDLRCNFDASSPTRRQKGREVNSREKYLDVRELEDEEEISPKETRHHNQERGKVQFEEALHSHKLPTTTKTSPEKGFKSTFECISTSQEETTVEKEVKISEPRNASGGSVFNFNENEVEVKRLEDIEEIDTEPETKKVKIFDSDEETSLLRVDSKVEQPKDSGYKSAIATPEPNDRLQPSIDADGRPSITSSHPEPSEPLITPKKIHSHISQLESSTIPNKYVSPGRRKNLADVIEERKRHAESEMLAGAYDNQNDTMNLIPSPHRPSMDPIYPDSVESTADSKGPSDSDGNNDNMGTPATSKSFVEEWRSKWVKSPPSSAVPHDHNDAGGSYPTQAHHIGIPDYPAYLPTYLSHLSMYQFYRYYKNQPLSMTNHEDQPRINIPPPPHRHNSPHSEIPSPNRNAMLLSEERCKAMGFPTNSGIPLGEIRPPQATLPSVAPVTSVSDIHNSEPMKDSLTDAGTPVTKQPASMQKEMTTIDLCSISQSPTSVASSFGPVALESGKASSSLTVAPSYHTRERASTAITHVGSALSHNATSTSTITTASSKLGSLPRVSPGSFVSSPTTKAFSPHSVGSDGGSTPKIIYSSVCPAVSVASTNTAVTCVVTSTNRTTVPSNAVTSIMSPIPSVVSPTGTAHKVVPPKKAATDNSISVRTLRSPDLQQKRVPIYMQEPKTPRPAEKRSPRNVAVSPRWNKEKKERKPKSSRKYASGKRGRGSGRGRGRGGYYSPRFGSVSVPKELVGTVYEFDDDFDDDGPANTLDDLRMLREKRQSVDTTPQQSYTPTYNFESPKESLPPKKVTKERKSKTSHKDKSFKVESVDEVAKILEDYKIMQNSTLKMSVHDPSPPHIEPFIDDKLEESPTSDPLALDEEKDLPNDNASLLSDDRNKTEPMIHPGDIKGATNPCATFTSVVTRSPDERTNQLRLKLKGPYANNYLHNNLSTSQPEVSANPIPPSTTTTLRRMRKKELIMQYCYQDMNTDQPDKNFTAKSHNPIKMLGITIPKAVASMTTIPTREDYKMYTQDGSNTSSRGAANRRRRPPRELKQLDWSLLEDGKTKRNFENSQDSGRKRARGAKETKLPEKEDTNASTGKLRISIGKKPDETVSLPPVDTRDFSSKGKPLKKRYPEDVSPFMKVMNDNLKFREEIMANFDKRSAENTKGVTAEKKSKKRRLALTGEGSCSSTSEIGEDGQDVKVIANEASHKFVLKISKGKTERGGEGKKSIKDDKPNSSGTTPNPYPHPLKIRLNLSNLSKSDNPEDVGVPETKTDEGGSPEKEDSSKIMPLKIKLQRGPAGYITSKNSKKGKLDGNESVPGSPHAKEPPPVFEESPIPPPPPPQTKDPPGETPAYKDSQIVHRDREALTKETIPSVKSPPRHSTDPEDVLERLEAQLAATDGPLSAPFSKASANPPHSFSSLQPVPALKDNSGCR